MGSVRAVLATHVAAVVTPYTIPVGIMDVLQVTLLVLVAAGGSAWIASPRRPG